MAPMPLTGTIGSTSSLKADGNPAYRRSLPEPVVSFHLPTVKRRPLPAEEPATRKGKNVVREDALQRVDGYMGDLDAESGLLLLQSLRQSRLVHLTALLPHLSTRHRTAIKYHPSPPGHPFPGGLDPSNTPHSLIHLGRADVRTGPLVFPKTRFGEVRVEGGVQTSAFNPQPKGSGKSSVEKMDDQPASSPTPAAPKAKAAPTSQPPIDDAVVQAVSKAAQKDAKLQTLLHTAANGKATPDELRELAKFISIVSESLAKDTNGSAAPAAKTAPSTSNASTAAPARKFVAPPPSQLEYPAYHPIITVEYRENPSARFVLPLWRGSVVERIREGEERMVKVTMLLPAIGSTAAARAASNADADGKGSGSVNGDGHSPGEASKTSPKDPPTKEQLRAEGPSGAETYAVTWTISGNSEIPLSDGIWHIFGRVDGARTLVDGKEERGEGDGEASEETVQRFVEKYKRLSSVLDHTPHLQAGAQGRVPRDLADHLTDKFAPRLQTLVNRPVVKLRRGEGEEEESVELVRDSAKRGWSSASAWGAKGSRGEKRKATAAGDPNSNSHRNNSIIDNGLEGEDSIMSLEESGTPSKPKRKRHVAKFNPDGTLKLCQACGTNSTPMWRRGPAGKSTLCNACGAKWKVGRLVVPNEPPAQAPSPAPAPASSAPRADSAGKEVTDDSNVERGTEEVPSATVAAPPVP